MYKTVDTVSVPPPKQFGFCEGVVAADNLLADVSNIAAEFDVNTVYGYHEIVHNASVVKQHEARGVVFVENLEDIPPFSLVVGSAHGSSPRVGHHIRHTGGLFIDGACPLVIKTHRAAQSARFNDEKVLYIMHGKPNETPKLHHEVQGTVGHLDEYVNDEDELVTDAVDRHYIELTDDIEKVADEVIVSHGRYRVIGQTTLLASGLMSYKNQLEAAILSRQPHANIERVQRRDVCFAVEDRQEGVRVELSKRPNAFIVVTDPNSKNGKGYADLARAEVARLRLSTEVVVVETYKDLDKHRSALRGNVAVTASASTPDKDTLDVVEALGGNPLLIPSKRAQFTLHNAEEQTLRNMIAEWSV